MYIVIVQVVDCPTFQAACGFDHCYTMGVKQGGQMCANVVELSCKLVIMSVVMESAKIPWEDIAQLKGKVSVWYLDNIPPSRDPCSDVETPMIQKLKDTTGAMFVVGVCVCLYIRVCEFVSESVRSRPLWVCVCEFVCVCVRARALCVSVSTCVWVLLCVVSPRKTCVCMRPCAFIYLIWQMTGRFPRPLQCNGET